MTCSPVGLISSMDRALRPAIVKVMVRFPIKPEFFQVLFQPFRLFILPRGSCSLSFLYPQLKRWSISYNYFNSESIILKIIRFGFCDIRNNLGQGKCYQSKPILRPWLLRFCLHCTTEHTKQHLKAWARWSARPMKHFINSREKLHCYSNSKNTPQPDS